MQIERAEADTSSECIGCTGLGAAVREHGYTQRDVAGVLPQGNAPSPHLDNSTYQSISYSQTNKIKILSKQRLNTKKIRRDMGFNDFITLNDKDYAVMQEKYNKILIAETEDLREIHTKMSEQKLALSAMNIDGRYDDIIDKITDNIGELNSLIATNNSNIYYNAKAPDMPQPRRASALVTPDETAISPVRSEREMEEHGQISTNLPPTETAPIPPRQMTRKRHSPMPSTRIATFIQSILGRRKKNIDMVTHGDYPQNRFHNIAALHNCQPRSRIESNQIDIIRLLLLYIALRPNCRYTSRLAHIASDQFNVLLNLGEPDARRLG